MAKPLNTAAYVGISAMALALAACGGGGGSGVASTPGPVSTPTPTPTPTPATLEVFEAPATQQFATLTSGSQDLQIRYDASTRLYEVSVDAGTWQKVEAYGAGFAFGPDNNPTFIDARRPFGYNYSSWVDWGPANTVLDNAVVGIPTPASGIPTAGSATFSGYMNGRTDATYSDGIYNYTVYASGTIDLSFDFAAGTMSGSATPEVFIGDFAGTTLPTISFVNTIYSSGSTTFSGKFDTTLPGPNAFSGQFTGPAAEELIGKWTLPFEWPLIGDGQVHSAWGVFVGKR